MAPPKKTTLPKPLPDAFILTDTCKKKWKLGRKFGQGGFGLIYLASQDVQAPVAEDTEFVIKVEYLANGPLFCELKFYQRAAKLENMQKWTKTKKLDFLGVPGFWGFGQAEHNGLSYRFMVMDRLGCDLQKMFERSGRFKKDTVLELGSRLVDALEYIHDSEYVHADIKASNLMLGFKDPHQVYLADYGLSYRFSPQGEHIAHKERPKDCHNGTIEYTSLDAHKGVSASRRSDLQILGFCLLHWVCGSLPWEDVLKNAEKVHEAKSRLVDGLPGSVKKLALNKGDTDEVANFLSYVKTLGYEDKPDYQGIKRMLSTKGGKKLDFSVPGSSDAATTSKKSGRKRGATKAFAATVDPDSDVDSAPAVAPKRRKKAAAKPRPRSRVKPPPVEDKEDQQQERPKPIDACYLRGPPMGERTIQTKEVVKRKVRSRPDPVPSVEEPPRPRRATRHKEV